MDGVWPARPHRPRVRLRVGRWGAFQHPARRRPALHPGNDRCAAQRREGVARGRGRLPGERRELEGAAARAQAARGGRAGGGGGGRRAGVRGGDARGLARDPRAGLLVSQARQRARQVTPTASAPRQTRAPRDDVRRVPYRLRGCTIAFRSGISGQVPQGGRVAYCQLGAPGYFLRLPRRALEAPAHHQCDRVAVRHRAPARARDQGRRFKNQGTADGVQAARHGTASLAAPRQRSAIAAGSCRREVRRWSPGRSRQTRYSVNRQSTKESRLIMAGRSTTFDNYSRLLRQWDSNIHKSIMTDESDKQWVLPASIPFADLKRRDLEECIYWLFDAMGAKDLEWRTGGSGGGAPDGGRDLEATFYTPGSDKEIESNST